MPNVPLHIHYQELMKQHPYGKALYQPVSNQYFKPGSCGYFDSSGLWNPIVQLSDPASLTENQFLNLQEELQKAPDDSNITWGPKCPSGVQSVKLNVSTSGYPPGIPVDAGVVYKYHSTAGEGAILMTKPPVVREAYYYESPFKNWVKDNAAAILRKRSEVQEYGLWIVTSTYSTEECSINTWTKNDQEVYLGFKLKMIQSGELGPHGEWYESSVDGGWSRFTAQENERKVVFFGGLHFCYSKIFENLKHAKEKKWGIFRGSETNTDRKQEYITTVSLSHEEFFQVDCDSFFENIKLGETEDYDDDW